MGDAERIMEMPRTQSYHEPRGPYNTDSPWPPELGLNWEAKFTK